MVLKNGDRIFIPVTADRGAFAGECLITLYTLDGPVSGFIRTEQVRQKDGQKYIVAEVVSVGADRIDVKLHGSFFTTTGLAHLSNKDSFERAA